MNPRVRLTYGIYSSYGDLLYVGLDGSEERAWTVYLGWPDEAEIAHAKKLGMECRKVYVTVR